MQIHELNNYTGDLDSGAYLAVDNGSDTGKVSTTELFEDTNEAVSQLDTSLNARIDNIIAGGEAPSASEIVDARRGANGVDYASLGTAIRTQFTDLKSETNELLDTSTTTETINGTPTMAQGYIAPNGSTSSSSSYTHTNKIAVNKGDVIKILVNGVARICRFVCAYSGETVVSASGAENVASFTVPYGIDYVVLSTEYSSTMTYTYSIERSHLSSERIDTLESDTELVNNLLNISSRTVTITDSSTMTSGYVPTNGTIQLSSLYVYTEKIAVAEGDVIHAYANGVQKSIRFICAYDNDIAISAKGAENVESYTVPSGVNYVRLSIAFASTWTYTYTITRTEQYSQRLTKIENIIEINKINSNSTNETFLESCKQSLKKNVCVSYFANFNEFTSLLIGFTKGTSTTDYIDWFEITSTNIILHRAGQTDITWTHGLTMQNYISVRISFDFAQHFIINVETNGGSFTQDNYVLLGSRYMPFAILTATSSANNKLSMTCKDFKRNILLFGDSYISNSSSRWIYYLVDSIDQLCLNGYSGEGSESAVYDFDKVIQLASPNYIVWCLGMNDGSDADDATPNGTWLSSIQHIISACEENGIIPILATIPSVPSINNRAKSAWVRSSGYKYIDFASAVNSDNSGNWYSGMLSSDNVHPTEQGAKTLYARAITDFPQLLVTSD